MRRLPVHPNTRRTVAKALRAVLAQMDGGPGAVTVAGVATAIGQSVDWIYLYLGNRDELLRQATEWEVDRLCAQLDRLARARLDPATRVLRVVEILLPKARYRSELWVLVIANRQGLGGRGRLAKAISAALARDMGPHRLGIGGGILGVLGEAVGTAWTPSREDLVNTMFEMTLAVHFHSRRNRHDRP